MRPSKWEVRYPRHRDHKFAAKTVFSEACVFLNKKLFLLFSFVNFDIHSPEERFICSQSYFAFQFVLGPGTNSTNCA